VLTRTGNVPKWVPGLLIAVVPWYAVAADKPDLSQLRSSLQDLVSDMVEHGVLTSDKAKEIERDAVAEARSAAFDAVEAATAARDAALEAMNAAIEARDAALAARSGSDEMHTTLERVAMAERPDGGTTVHVTYVPEFVKDEIREQVRAEVRQDVTEDVIEHAKEESWGIADALPDWVRGMNWSTDVRLRSDSNLYDDQNIPNSIINPQAVNDAGGIVAAGADAFSNTTEDRHRLRARWRLAMEAKPSDQVTIGARLITGNADDPVSANQTLGDDNLSNFTVLLDRAFLQWDRPNFEGFNWLTLTGGRMPNPYFSTDLLWDEDLNFDGLAGSVRHNFGPGGDLFAREHPSSMVFFTFGAFSIDENELPVDDDSSNDKWLLGAQLGYEHNFANQSGFKVGLAFYDYVNVTGDRNTFGSTLRDVTAPAFVQIGNTLYDIRNDNDLTTNLLALAADYSIIDLLAEYRYTGFAPIHLVVTADILDNIAYDEGEILARTGTRVPERNTAYYIKFEAGWPVISKWGDWSVFGGYKYLQRDAVIDSFTDSDFHLGGTNAKGWILGTKYGLTHNTWVRARWISSDEIDGPPFGVDVVHLDLNAAF
jgi:polyhydroxyalkanoate synthesis regulator phasin